jgi:hypothetical protein
MLEMVSYFHWSEVECPMVLEEELVHSMPCLQIEAHGLVTN